MAIDLDARRADRAHARAAARQPVGAGEANGDTAPILLNGTVIAELPAEVPMAALLPLLALKDDAMLLIREAVRIAGAGTSGAALDAAATQMVIDVLVTTPDLPQSLIDTVTAVGRELLGADGFQAVVDAVHLPATDPGRFTMLDAGALIKGIVGWYTDTFRSLGKSSTPASSAPSGGTTSNTTSRPSSVSTLEGSGPGQDTPGT